MTKDAQPPMTASAQLDQQLAREAMKKALAGQSLTAREREALKRHEKQKEEKLRWAYYRSIPLKHWRTMSGRQTKVLKEQAALYGIPFAGATISLPDVVRAIHDFLARNAQKLACDEDELLEAKVCQPGAGTLPRGAGGDCPIGAARARGQGGAARRDARRAFADRDGAAGRGRDAAASVRRGGDADSRRGAGRRPGGDRAALR